MKQLTGEYMTILIFAVIALVGLAHLVRSRGWFR